MGSGDRPVTDRRAECLHIHLQEEVAERRIRWGPPQLKPKRLGERAVVTASKPLQIPQALATAQDTEHRHEQQITGRNADPTPHAGIRY